MALLSIRAELIPEPNLCKHILDLKIAAALYYIPHYKIPLFVEGLL
jgi:hypothetical protein